MSVIRAAGDKFSVSKRLNWRRETVFIFIISKDTPFQWTRPTRFMVNSHFTPNTARPLLKYSGTEESELISDLIVNISIVILSSRPNVNWNVWCGFHYMVIWVLKESNGGKTTDCVRLFKDSKRKMTLTIPCTSSVPRGTTARVRSDRVDTVFISCASVVWLLALVAICWESTIKRLRWKWSMQQCHFTCKLAI